MKKFSQIIITLACVLCLCNLAQALPQRAPLDFDGDNKTDYVVLRNSGASGRLIWYLQQSTQEFSAQQWGLSDTDFFVPGDYDGDLKWDIAVYRMGVFHILQSSTGTLLSIPFGQVGDSPTSTQDFDGDGRVDPTVTRIVDGQLVWYIQQSSLGAAAITFGQSDDEIGDIPVRGDFDGDGKADPAVYRVGFPVAANTFYVLRSSDGAVQAQTFGNIQTDWIVSADFDGDGKTDYAVWRGKGAGTNGAWYWLQSSDGAFRSLSFGLGGAAGSSATDKPTPGDYDGDGKTDQSVWRPGTPATFYVNRSNSGFHAFQFGRTGDTAGAWLLSTE
jgi:hypothetical protein